MLIHHHVRDLLRFHLHAFYQGIQLLNKKPFATFLTAVTLGITLTLPTLFWIATHALQDLFKHFQAQTPISLYLSTTATSTETHALLQRIQSMPSIEQATFISPEQGLAELQRQAGMQSIFDALSENPLPGVIQVSPAPTFQNPEMLQQLVNQLKILPHVTQSTLDLPGAERWDRLLKLLSKITHLIIAILSIGSLLIIGNTLHLIIQQKQTEIHLLQLLGATPRFIARPFLYAGMAYGFISALLAIFLVKLVLWQLANTLPLSIIPNFPSPLVSLSVQEASLLIIIALFLGWSSAKLSMIRRFNDQFAFH